MSESIRDALNNSNISSWFQDLEYLEIADVNSEVSCIANETIADNRRALSSKPKGGFHFGTLSIKRPFTFT